MAASATNIFQLTGVQPAFGSWNDAKRIAVKLPASVTYGAGTVLGEIVGTNEVQSLALTTGGTLGGTYTLAFGGAATGNIAFNATAATVQAALEGLATVGTNNVLVSGTTPTTSGGTLTITFRNALGKQNVAAIVPDATNLTGTTPGAAITTGTAGSGTANEVQVVYASGTVSGGTFTITYSGQTTSALDYNATTAAVQTALEALSNLAPGDVVVTGTAGTRYILTFGGTLVNTDVSAVTIGNGSITGGGSYLVATATAGQAGSNGTYKAYLSSSTDGSETAKAILEFACATDSSGNITLGTGSAGGDKQQFAVNASVPAFVAGTFRCEDLQQTAGAGQLTEAAVASLGVLIAGSVTNGLLRIG